MWLQRGAVNDIDRSLKQAGNKFFKADILVNCTLRFRLKLNQNIKIAVGPIRAPRLTACKTGN